VLQSTFARFDLERLVEDFRWAGGDDVAELARRSYSGDAVSDDEWARVFAAFVRASRTQTSSPGGARTST
jgi:hypothetical protein